MHTVISVKITFDAIKDSANIAKHSVSLAEAVGIEWDSLWALHDVRRDYGEQRYIGYVILADRLYCVVFTDRGAERRIISLRKANPREVRNYAANY